MRLCTRCAAYKPNANFAKEGQYGGEFWERCLHCRTIHAEMREKCTKPPRQAARIPRTLHDDLLVMVARTEFNAFVARGAREISRPYTHDGTGSLVGRRFKRQRRGPDLTNQISPT